jgi:hypothetical protein
VANAADQVAYVVDLGPLAVEAADRLFERPLFTDPVGATFGSEIQLLGYDLSVAADNQATMTLIWQALETPAADYTVFVHVLNPDGSCCLWQQDVMPQQGRMPTTLWLANEVVVDPYMIVLPEGTPAGSYPIEVGLYIAETGQRLAIEQGVEMGDAVRLRPITVP